MPHVTNRSRSILLRRNMLAYTYVTCNRKRVTIALAIEILGFSMLLYKVVTVLDFLSFDPAICTLHFSNPISLSMRWIKVPFEKNISLGSFCKIEFAGVVNFIKGVLAMSLQISSSELKRASTVEIPQSPTLRCNRNPVSSVLYNFHDSHWDLYHVCKWQWRSSILFLEDYQVF